ncbi:fatty acid metabolism regulator protein [mine drainage metagenome]|uniref:Fatty acid metabolism regulator protein n=1 Tax=mine drainage metagenome TaxID=410659 RepID=A0A1J5RKC7_9ZZZZ
MESQKPADKPLEAAVLRYAREQPQLGQARVAAALNQLGQPVSPSGVRYIWRKHDLETAYKRLKALEKKTAANLTAEQREVLRRGDVTRKFARKSRLGIEGDGGADERRNHILLAAAELFSQQGYGGTSIRDIARRVGLLPGSVYHYYPAKEDLFVAVHREGFGQLIARVEERIRKQTDPWLRLELACAEHIAAISGDKPIHQITGTGLFAIHEEHLQRRVRADREKYDQIFRQLVADLKLPRGTDRSLFRLALLGALNWSRVWYRQGKSSPREIARQMMKIFRGAQQIE